MLVGTGMVALGAYAMARLTHARWRARRWEASEPYRDYWKRIGPTTIWLVGGIFMVLAYFKDYCHKTRTCTFPSFSAESCTASHSDGCFGPTDAGNPFPAIPVSPDARGAVSTDGEHWPVNGIHP